MGAPAPRTYRPQGGRPINPAGQRASRTARKGSASGGYLYIPTDLFGMIPEDARFICELVEDGVLFRRVPPLAPPPAWVKS